MMNPVYDDDEERDPEEPEDFDRDSEEEMLGTDTEECPFCKQEVHARTDICPHCGSFISWEEEKPTQRGVWVITAVILLVTIALMILLFGHYF